MQVPAGQVNPGLSFFRAIQGLISRPSQPSETGQSQTVARATDQISPQQRFATDAAQAARAADPTEEADDLRRSARSEVGEAPPERRTVGGGTIVPRGSVLNIVV
jgi:hypothetical protein